MLCDMELESRPSAVGFEYSLRFGMAVCVSKFKTVVRIAGDL